MIVAAGLILLSPQGRVLLLRRSSEGDAAGQWAFPGGKLEDGEDHAKAAARETLEEIGYRAGSPGAPLMRRIKDDVDFTTFVVPVDEEFVPKLNSEHTAWAWVDPAEALGEPPGVGIPAPALAAAP